MIFQFCFWALRLSKSSKSRILEIQNSWNPEFLKSRILEIQNLLNSWRGQFRQHANSNFNFCSIEELICMILSFWALQPLGTHQIWAILSQVTDLLFQLLLDWGTWVFGSATFLSSKSSLWTDLHLALLSMHSKRFIFVLCQTRIIYFWWICCVNLVLSQRW